MSKTKRRTWTAREILERLRIKYGANLQGRKAERHAVLSEVASGTGFAARRYCDALVFGLWPSTGLGVDGFEIKVTRGDWLREIQDPTKAEEFIRYCHRWWILAAPGVVKLEELPATWGLMEPSGSGLRVRKPAEKTAAEPPSPTFLAAIARYAVRQSPAAEELQAARDEATKAERERVKKLRTSTPIDRREATRLRELERAVAEFEETSGLTIKAYEGGQLGRAVEIVRAGRLEAVEHELRRSIEADARSLKWKADQLERDRKRLEKLEAAKGAAS